jgi:hypothetical protein
MEDDLLPVMPFLDALDAIPRRAFQTYRHYPAEILLDHTPRAAANCTYDHMFTEAERQLSTESGVTIHEIRGLKLFGIGITATTRGALVRFKRMDEDGRSRNYPTKQARDYDRQIPLPGIPDLPVRLTVGYLLDATQTEYIRTQIAKPIGSMFPEFCVAIVTDTNGSKALMDVTRQRGLGE